MTDIANTLPHPNRDTDLKVASRFAQIYRPEQGDYFVLTGSYSMEALSSNRSVTHNDVDANVFTRNMRKSMARTAATLTQTPHEIVKNTGNRLEYLIDETLIELQFVPYESANGERVISFTLPDRFSRKIIVPTVTGSLTDASQSEHVFRVKSLPYALATWVLRITGAAIAQKRGVRLSDIDHFAILAQLPYERSQVVDAMLHHPQMPIDPANNTEALLEEALSIARDREGFQG